MGFDMHVAQETGYVELECLLFDKLHDSIEYSGNNRQVIQDDSEIPK